MDDLRCGYLSGRRAFLKAVLPGGALMCLGAPCLLRAIQAGEQAKPEAPKHKFLSDAGMSYAQVFGVAYRPDIPIWRGLEKELGRERLHEMLKRIIDATTKEQMAEYAKKAGSNDLAAFTKEFRQTGGIYEKALTYEIVEETPKAFEVKVTECLWAKTFRDANAGDLGYVLICYGDYASAEGFNPKMRMIRTKTLMQGDDFCNHRYVLEA